MSVKIGKEFCEKITRNIGVPQGDYLSQTLFTLYLADALKTERSKITEEHNCSKILMNSEDLLQEHLKDHTYNLPQENGLLIDQQYADDTGQVEVNAKHRTEKIKKRVPTQFNKKNQQVNKSKTEEYTIKRNGQTDWKRCKYLHSLLDTEEDIKRRKALAIAPHNKLKNNLENKSTSMKTKIRILKFYIESVFIYNSELWTLTKLPVNESDIFQRGVIKKIYNIH